MPGACKLARSRQGARRKEIYLVITFMNYKHTQIGYLMIVVTLVVLMLFEWAYITTAHEPPSVDSGNNLLTTGTMLIVLFILTSFTTLQVHIDKTYLHIKFGYGIFKKKFSLHDIVSAKTVKNHWWYGWGIRGCFWPKIKIWSRQLWRQLSNFYLYHLTW